MEVITLTWFDAKNFCIFALDAWISFHDSLKTLIFAKYLPPANEVCEDYVFTGVCLSTGGSVRGCSQEGGMHGCSGGACMVARGGMHGCSGGDMHGCSGGACMVAPGGACMVALGG